VNIVCAPWVLVGGEGQDMFKVVGEVYKDVERFIAETENAVGR